MTDEARHEDGGAAFPILTSSRIDRFPDSVPWSFVSPHERRAQQNHSQSLKRLAERGGLDWLELERVVTDKPWDLGCFIMPRDKDKYMAALGAAAERVCALLRARSTGTRDEG